MIHYWNPTHAVPPGALLKISLVHLTLILDLLLSALSLQELLVTLVTIGSSDDIYAEGSMLSCSGGRRV
ncbi:hypothetical protein DFJ58DRAFT_743872 [Suillus subalutaceus]|uniref:uncharacterized protein n=1 Tax=Suillus subalutaceus TaxID=48586 RepID=UPI001B879702|nr:uncharacterized protein DFJ58DRAFT_743841 [Suillus subalutaceus]XP_041246748.1 uncharacterized protein DFJ58DRAFT_743872 [Suillus subalutaceus]KAG1863208.1 hypothetical protein DFJ58DRAFT_743841 [Suillus subalutaceus]KAG1863281.1 hypothetical protein DFJ58DRAFT_743872 [Suillus subalutaceus]